MNFDLSRERALACGQCWVAVHTQQEPRTYLIATDERFELKAVRLVEDGALINTRKTATELFDDLEAQGYNLYLGRIAIEVVG